MSTFPSSRESVVLGQDDHHLDPLNSSLLVVTRFDRVSYLAVSCKIMRLLLFLPTHSCLHGVREHGDSFVLFSCVGAIPGREQSPPIIREQSWAPRKGFVRISHILLKKVSQPAET